MEKKVKTNKATRITILVVILVIIFLSLTVLIGVCDLYGSSFLTSKFFKETKANNYASQIKNCEKEKIVFFGDSITEMYELKKYYKDATIYNRGISGDTTTGMINRLQTNVIDLSPTKLFFLGGANDLNTSLTVTEIADNIKIILTSARSALPKTQIVVQTVYPFNPSHKLYGILNSVDNRKNEDVVSLNILIKKICFNLNITCVDTYKYLQKDGILDKKFSLDGLHINDLGYKTVTSVLSPYVFDTINA